MYIISRNGHLGLFVENIMTLFVEHETALFNSRKNCLNYLTDKCKLSKDQAVHAITAMHNNKGCWVSF